MLNKYKNSFFEVLLGNNKSPSDFNVKDEEDGNRFIIQYKKSPMRFNFLQSATSFRHFHCYYSLFKPQFPIKHATIDKNHVLIGEALNIFDEWLNNELELFINYLSEMNEPNLWDQLKNQDTFLSGADITENDLSEFSIDEKVQIRLSINEFKFKLIKDLKPEPDEIKIIENRLNYLSESLDRLNKFDWKGVALNTLITISITLSLDTEKGKLLFEMFKRAFSVMLKLIN
jgi:hypothetical protein